jgi:branched-chain amino acid transport system ATP-binding protein
MLLDEPLEGLAPILVEELLVALRRVIRDEGTSAILVEQNAKKILSVTDRAIFSNAVRWCTKPTARRSPPTARRWSGISA